MTKIKYLIIHPKIAELPKYMVLAGLLYSSFLSPLQVAAADAKFITYETPAILALAHSTPIRVSYASADEQTQNKNMFAMFQGSTLAGQTNPFALSSQSVNETVITPVKKTTVLAAKTSYSPIEGTFTVKEVKRNIIVTAYSSTVDQCDASPFITAMGSHVRDGIVASNFLPFGAKVRFPDMYGDKIFVVEDRMAKKNSYKIDIWMETRAEAMQFGVRRLTVEILE